MAGIRYFISSALRNLWESKVTSFFTLVTLAVALGFLGAYLAIFINMKAALGAVAERVPLTVYLSEVVSQAQKEAVQARLAGDPSVAGVSFTSKEKALSEFGSGMKREKDLIGSLGANPLPASFDVTLKAESPEPAVAALVQAIQKYPGVDEVQYLQAEAGKLKTLFRSFTVAGGVLGLGVLLGVVFISYSTLRLAVLNHTDEIAVMKLMGARKRFIMGPFLFEGAFQGLVASVLALGLLFVFLRAVSDSAAVMLLAPSGIAFLPTWGWGGMILAGGLFGLTGSFFAFYRTLRL